jgi:hypothetical protein
MFPSEHSEKILALLEFVLKYNMLSFMDKIYLQIFGIAMGTSLAPMLANIFMALLEHKINIIANLDNKLILPIFFKRFIDDGLGVMDGTLEQIKYFVKIFNSIIPSIQISIQSIGNAVNFLDLVIFKGSRFEKSGIFDLKVYQKPLNNYSYIPFGSAHQNHIIDNFVKNELERYVKICSKEEYFFTVSGIFFSRLRKRGYPRFLLRRISNSVVYSMRSSLLKLNNEIPSACSNCFQTIKGRSRAAFISDPLQILLQEKATNAEDESRSGASWSCFINKKYLFDSAETLALCEQNLNSDHLNVNVHNGSDIQRLLVYKVENHPIFEDVNLPGIINEVFKKHLANSKEFFKVFKESKVLVSKLRNPNLKDKLRTVHIDTPIS